MSIANEQPKFRDPYASQNRRNEQIAERKAATYTVETLPEHLEETMELAEQHFRDTAPAGIGPSTEVPKEPAYDPRPVEHRPWRENLPAEQHIEAGLGGLAAARAALDGPKTS